MELHDIKELLLNPSITESQLIKEIRGMSDAFTVNREKIGEYVMSEDSVSAYTSFYLPTNVPKFSFIVEQLPEAVIADLQKATFVDFGSGPGTYSLAMLEQFPDFCGSLIMVDNSELMIAQAQKLIDGLYPHRAEQASYHSKVPDDIEGEVKVLFFGHSTNEIGTSDTIRMIRKLDPDYVFIIEPGTKESFTGAIKIRRKMVSQEYNMVYPCPSMAKCPMERRPGDWCHGVINMVHSHELERLSQLVSLDRKTMPFIGHLYSKNISPKESGERGRLIQIIEESKHSYGVGVCRQNKDKLQYQKLQLVKKTMGKKQAKEFKKINRGVEIEYEVLKELPDGVLRANLK